MFDHVELLSVNMRSPLGKLEVRRDSSHFCVIWTNVTLPTSLLTSFLPRHGGTRTKFVRRSWSQTGSRPIPHPAVGIVQVLRVLSESPDETVLITFGVPPVLMPNQ